MAKQFMSIHEEAFRRLLETAMGFQQNIALSKQELVWERTIPGTHYGVRVLSSVREGVTAARGSTAIRVCLVDFADGRMIRKPVRINRAQHALPNLRQRVGELWRWVLDHPCPQCDGILVERSAKTLSCCNYPRCQHVSHIQ